MMMTQRFGPLIALLSALAAGVSSGHAQDDKRVALTESPVSMALSIQTLHPIADIVQDRTKAQVRRIETDFGTDDERLALQNELQDARVRVSDDLARAIRNFVEPAWNEAVNELQADGERALRVTGTPAQQEWIESLLGEVRGRMLDTIDVRLHFIDVPIGGLEALGLVGPVEVLQDEASYQKVLDDALTIADTERLSAPRLLMNVSSRASMTVQEEIAYIKEFETRIVAPDKTLIADPIIDTVQEGYALEIYSSPLPGAVTGLEIELLRSSVTRPMATKKVRLSTSGGGEGTICMPEVTNVRVRSNFILSDGQAVVFTTPSSQDDRDLVVVLAIRAAGAADRDPQDEALDEPVDGERR